jgi:hypothetical protein
MQLYARDGEVPKCEELDSVISNCRQFRLEMLHAILMKATKAQLLTKYVIHPKSQEFIKLNMPAKSPLAKVESQEVLKLNILAKSPLAKVGKYGGEPYKHSSSRTIGSFQL